MSLKVFDLQCEHSHVFEGWFSSFDSYESQVSKGLLSCPICDSRQITKKLSAPRINKVRDSLVPGATIASAAAAGSTVQLAVGQAASTQAVAGPNTEQLAQLQAKVMRHIREIVRNTENVGDKFAQEARSMHEGDIPERAIRGTATAQERESLAQDGIAVLPIPEYLDDDRLQ